MNPSLRLRLGRVLALCLLPASALACSTRVESVRPEEPSPPRPGSAGPSETRDDPGDGLESAIELRYPRSETPWLGVEIKATKRPNPGVEVLRVLPGSPARKAKLLPGDVILTLGDQVVMSPEDVADWVKAQPTGTSAPITISRAGVKRLFRAELEGAPEYEDRLRLQLVHRLAPEVSGVTTYQGEVSSLREVRGQVVILEFWGAFCPVCRYMTPVVEGWHRTYQPQGAVVFAISTDPEAVALSAARRTGKSYSLARDHDGKAIRAYMASQIPIVVIIDKKGIVRDAVVGYSAERLKETEALIESLLAEPTEGA